MHATQARICLGSAFPKQPVSNRQKGNKEDKRIMQSIIDVSRIGQNNTFDCVPIAIE
jgi:hypothetical protein